MSRICVIGASGYLGSHLCVELVRSGYNIISVDMVPSEKGEYRKADIRNEAEILEALEGSDIVIHCASIHPWKKYTDEQYLDINVKGTWNIFKAVLQHNIKRIILTSSIAAVGYNPDPSKLPVDESYQTLELADIYSLTKSFQEQIARSFCLQNKMKVIALRPPNFTPKPPIQNESALLSGCSVVDDVASAHLKAIDAWDRLQNNFEAFFITQSFPYSSEDTKQLSKDPKSVVEKYYPGAWEWFLNQGITLHPVATYYDNSKAKRILGWEPKFTFERWWTENQKNIT